MTVSAKICGVNASDAVAAAVAGGASHVGFNFYPSSPRYVTPATAARLAAEVPSGVARVALFADAFDDAIDEVFAALDVDLLQLHGDEGPDRVAALRARLDVPVMKALRIADAADVAAADAFVGVADWLLFDARPPSRIVGALPGGNALRFDWRLIAGREWPVPWMLSGGLDADNVAEAVAATGARTVDVSSGVEDVRGHKDPAKISAFLAAVARL